MSIVDQAREPLASEFLVAVLMRRRCNPAKAWLRETWRVSGVVVNSRVAAASAVKVRSTDQGDEYLWGGLAVRLHKDEAESYYHNLISDRPQLYVISAVDDQGRPEPFLVSASFDEAHAYLEAEGEVDAVPMPPELYQWLERFVLTHYVPERRTKRKRRNWVEESLGKR